MAGVLGRRPFVVDAAVAAVLVVIGLVEAFATPTNRPLWLHVPVAVAVMGAIAFRRVAPLVVIPVVVLGTILIDPNGELAIFVALLLVSYTGGAELDPPRSWVGLALALGPFYVFLPLNGGVLSDYVAITILYGGGWLVGRLMRERTRHSAQLAERAERAEREREEKAARAVAEERTRIARELHDIVAHSLSVVTLQTQAVRRRLDPALTREIADLASVETAARQAMAEVRRLFGMLRADGERPALEPQPGLDQLDRLVADTRAAGTPVDLAVEGDPVPLPPGHDLAAYRIVQESLTNVRKHAPGCPADVCLRYGPAELAVTVRNRGGVPPPRSDGGGLGLVGMRERVGLYGGTVEAHPVAGGFVVRAVLPLREGVPV